MKPIELWHKYAHVLAFLGIALLLSAVLGLFALTGAKAGKSFMEEKAKLSAFRDLEKHLGKADSLGAVFTQAEERMHAWQMAFPRQGEVSNVLSVLVEGTKGYNLKISDVIALDELPRNDAYVEFPFEIRLTGSYPDLSRYLIALENLDMVVRVRRLDAKSLALNKPEIAVALDLSVFGTRAP